ncbi:MAG: DegT/DnrJ/EryC1/StrS family aminotransferase [Vicinamibacterales bacterium]
MTSFIPQMEPLITDADVMAVHDYMRSGGWLTEFEQTRRFEQQIAGFTGAQYCVATPNGTLALFLALAACDIGCDDEVIVPDLTMAATATAVLLTGGKVVFADIEPRTLCLDLRQVEQLITSRTKAIVFVPLNGRSPSGLPDAVRQWQRRGIRVIEDAAQALGSYVGGRHLGSLGDCGCLSFSSQKIITTGQGGAVITDGEHLHDTMRMVKDFGRREGGRDHYLRVGWNLKFTDLQAVVGLEQMRRLPAIVEHKRRLFAWYRELLDGVNQVELPSTDLAHVTPWFVDLLVESAVRDRLAEHLRRAGIGTRPSYPPLHAEPAFQTAGSFPVAEAISRRMLWLPSSLRLGRAEVVRICSAIQAFYTA